MASKSGLEVSLDMRDLAGQIVRIQGFETVATGELKTATVQSLSLGQRILGRYPPQNTSFRMRFKSDRQRRWFFWALRTGLIQVPYRRTTTLGPRWNFTEGFRRLSGGGWRGHLNNVTSYAQWVQDERKQAQVHRGRWSTVQTLTRAPARVMRQYFQRALRRMARRLIRR